MADQDDSKRERSPRFPFIPLEKAIERARQYYAKERRGAAVIGVAGQHWSYSEKSSGLQQTIGALKSYGLLQDDGSGPQRKIRLTDLAFRILLDERPISPDRDGYLRIAALTPPIAKAIYEQYPENPPSEANLKQNLIFDHKFPPDAAASAVDIFFKNLAFTKLYDSDTMLVNTESLTELMDSPAANTGQKLRTPNPLDTAAPVTMKTEKIIGPKGAILLQFADEPTWESYDFLESYIKLRKSVLKRGD